MRKKSKSILLLATLSVLFSVGCSSTKVAETAIVPEIIPEVVETKTPVILEEPKAESVVSSISEVEVEKTQKEEFRYDYVYEYAGYKIYIEVHNGYGYVSYPAVITENDIITAAKAFTSVHGDFNIKYFITEPGKLYATFPENLTKADFDYIANIAGNDLTWYLNRMFAPTAITESVPERAVSVVIPTVVDEPKTEQSVEPEVSIPAVVDKPKAEQSVKPEVKIPAVVDEPKTEQSVEPEVSIPAVVDKQKTEPAVGESPIEVTPATEKDGISGLGITLIAIGVLAAGAACYYFLVFKKKS